MKKILTLTSSILIITTSFTACGGGGDSASFKNANTIIQIADCNSSSNIADYTKMQSKDTIIKNETDTTIKTFHDINGGKTICVVNGSAQITR